MIDQFYLGYDMTRHHCVVSLIEGFDHAFECDGTNM
jgi:hypothetical protein